MIKTLLDWVRPPPLSGKLKKNIFFYCSPHGAGWAKCSNQQGKIRKDLIISNFNKDTQVITKRAVTFDNSDMTW